MDHWQHVVWQGVAASVSPSTLRSYDKAWKDFLAFHRESVAVGVELRPSSSQVLQYLAHLFQQGRAARTLKLQAAAISFFSKALFDSDPCAKFVVRRALEGWGRLRTPQVAARRPISFELLTSMRSALRSICWSKYEARLFAAAFSLTFFGALRIGEVLLETFATGLNRGLLYQDASLSDAEVTLTIRSSKTDQLGRGTVMALPATGRGGPCPVKDLARYLAVRPSGEGPLLIHADGQPVTRQQFSRVMRKAISACGVSAVGFAPHSFRIGAATTAAHWGLSVARIKNMGRWKSEAYRGYVRRRR